MKLHRQTTLPLPLAAVLLAFLAAGCLFSPDDKKDPGTPPTSSYKPPISAANVLDNLIKAYVDRDIDEYDKLFSTGDYRFVFDPTDVEQDEDLPPFWDWTDERLSAFNMFDSEDVLEIRLDFVKGTVQDAEQADDPRGPDWKKMVITEVDLEVETRDPQGGENIIYKVAGDRATFFFRIFADELVDDGNGGQAPRWRIVEWRDERVGGRPIL